MVNKAVQLSMADSHQLQDAKNERGQRQQGDEKEDDAMGAAHSLSALALRVDRPGQR
jgi:hypothetical protein